ncbi:carbohydrate kinase family protein [Luteimonas aquatica]|uniref:carbohydrate kinase family protein n=1 Tax=Luteimonas aquatica TaxID=450364 RepID=UPI001F58BD12|nr:carbohydrate kinase [Luteimonas aquatica]
MSAQRTAARTWVACFGEALIDFLARPAAAPGQPRQFAEYAGGAPANVAVGVARLGGQSRFIGMLSTDMFGDFLLGQFQGYGVDTAQVRRTEAARTALAFVSLGLDGERSFNFYRPPAADLLFQPQDFDAEAFADTAVFHVCSNSLTAPAIAGTTLHGMELAARAGALVSMDLNLRPSLWPADVDPTPTLWHALAPAHLVKLSREEFAFLARDGSEERVLARLFEGATQVLIVTDGPARIRWWTREASGTAGTFAVDAVDTTAAGDAFVAGLLHRLGTQGIAAGTLAAAFADASTREDLLRYAAAAGALTTTRFGAFAALPTHEQVRELIEAGPRQDDPAQDGPLPADSRRTGSR